MVRVVDAENGRKRSWKEKVSDNLHRTADWIRYNQETVVLLAPVAIAGITGLAKITKDLVRLGIAANERKVTDRRCYDPSEGHYWNLKRPLSNSDWLEVSHRQAGGEKMGDILSDMKVLKR